MPDWRTDLRAAIGRATTSGALALLEEALKKLLSGDASAARTALDAARSGGLSNPERELIRLALASGSSKTVARTARFLIDQGLRDLRGVVADAAALAIGKEPAGLLVDGLQAVASLAAICQAVAALSGSVPEPLLAVLADRMLASAAAVLTELSAQAGAIEAVLGLFLDRGLLKWTALASLFDAILAIADPRTADRVFAALIGALVALANPRGAAETLGAELARWLLAVDSPKVPVSDPLLEHTGITREVPRSYTLLAAGLGPVNADPVVLGRALRMLQGFVTALVAAGDAVATRVIVEMGRVPGLLLALLPGLIRWAADRRMGFLDWIGRDLSTVGLELKELPAPREADGAKPAVKYMIFSDVHRDDPQDVVDPMLFDISHFRHNRQMYLAALEYCENGGYRVIENGDCEELWYTTLIADPAARAQRIIADHPDVFDVLSRLHAQGRYFRTRGNHDNWWFMEPGRMGPLDKAMRPDPSAPPFTLWDALVIPGVRSMSTEHLLPPPPTNDAELAEFINDLPLGLSPLRYDQRLPMVLMHGHQVDFWNCNEHYLLGFALTNAFGVPFDGIDALPYFFKGVDVGGNPLVDFGDLVTAHYPYDNWLPDPVARKWARQIETMPETDRRLADSVSYSETLAASLTLLLRYGPGPSICSLPGPQVQIAFGHTHNPQSRPYLHLPGPDAAKPLLSRTINQTKLPYYNSGTTGWWEKVIWAIEITEIGQPRLVYWDENSKQPQTMTWELHNLELPTDQAMAIHRARWNALSAQIGARLPTTLGPFLGSLVDPKTAWGSAWGDGLQLDLGPADRLRQGAAASLAQLAALRDAACGQTVPERPMVVTIDFQRIDLDGPLHAAATPGPMHRPSTPLAQAGARILEGIGMVPGSLSVLADAAEERVSDLISALLYLAVIYQVPALHGIGMSLVLTADRRRSVRWALEGTELKLEIRLGGP